jgi:hypothetical protein
MIVTTEGSAGSVGDIVIMDILILVIGGGGAVLNEVVLVTRPSIHF